MPKKDESPDWAGKGFSVRNEESAPEPKQPKLRVVPKVPARPEPYDEDEWVWQ